MMMMTLSQEGHVTNVYGFISTSIILKIIKLGKMVFTSVCTNSNLQIRLIS